MEKKIVIIGAGPTGLGAAYRLKELGHKNFAVYDRLPYIGGLASSFTDSAGFTWDIGGHVMFSHYKYYDDVFDKLMGKDCQLNMRECWVRMFETWVPYPFQNNIRYLPKDVTLECLLGLVEAQTRRNPKAAKNFEEFIDAVFGDGIAKHFMKPYNFKVWAHPPAMMNKEWIGERVAVLDISRAIKNVVLGSDDFGWGPNNQFKFPLFGGTGEFYRRFEKPLAGHVHLNKTVDVINPARKEVRFQDGEIVAYDELISTIPLDKLCNNVLTGEVPREIKKAAASLRHSGGYMIGIGIKQPCPSTKSWMYFPESNCPFYRVTYLSNYSPHMTPDNSRYYSLLCEVSYSEFKPVDETRVVDETIQGLVNAGLIKEEDRKDIVDTWVFDAKYSYPTPSVERDEILSEVIPFLESQQIYSRGRFGMWKYEVSNTDHSLMQGVELVNRLLLNEPETTIGMTYSSTTDGRNAAVHERSPRAGSGDPRRSVVSTGPAKTNPDQLGDQHEAHISEEELGVTVGPSAEKSLKTAKR
ncbi:protoporphyrinogen/coproporphyrinogen oxidase [Humisphaera borealis]|uniref:FAD-dependent oxidoreductase n=1 Tax=Humisphaera borealis TaxID=2807512 RepID=A0A7M2WSM4_9BACT|nr:FAD-dependent oxidoreductase [Humisphaera borealis]QOV88419.1 FAD-dependent oxidoreductase [Humisphaera borealis]